MKQPFVLSILGFTGVLFSSCMGQDNVISLQEFVAVTNSKSVSNSRPVTDSVQVSKSKPIVPAQYQHILGLNYQKWAYPDLQVGEYVRRVFEDKDGNLWFGTNGEGIARFNGKELSYYSTFNGLSGSQVTAILEDAGGSIWCATQGGISRFGDKGITNYTVKDGLADNWVWSLYQDSKGTIWAGTLKGLSRFDGTQFTSFALPATKAAHPTSQLSTTRVSAITEDKSGNLWFGTDGGGAYSFNGDDFTNFTTGDGLCDNNITSIVKDSKGNIWFGSMNGGLCRYDPSAYFDSAQHKSLRAGGSSFTSFNQKDGIIGNNEVWNIYEDKKGNIWFSSEGYGVYRYDGKNFTNFGEREGLGIKAVQTIYEDSKGRLWIGGGGGLYRFDGKDTFFNVTREGLKGGC